MRKSGLIACLFAVIGLAACDGDPSFTGGTAVTNIAGITVLTSSPTLQSGAGQSVTITATVSDAGGLPIEGVEVTLSADSGSLSAGGPLLTDVDGNVTATLNAGADPANRTITVTASAGGLQDSVTVDVVGTTLSIAGPAGLPNGGTGHYTATLLDSAMTGIAGETVDISSDTGNTLSANSLMTDASGAVQFQVTGVVTGTDTLTASSLGLVATLSLNVTDDTFVLTAPAAGTQIQLNVDEAVELTWMIGGNPQAGQTITFTTTRGVLSSATADTDAAGVASVTISSAEAGPALISATNAAGTTAQVQVDFVAPVAVGAPGVGKPSGTSAAPQSAWQDFAADGHAGATISLATENAVGRSGASSYRVEFAVRLTDSQGAGIAGVPVHTGVRSSGYLQGAWNWHPESGRWVQSVSAGPCAVDDTGDEVATLSSGAVVTDANGWGFLRLTYPRDYARWVEVALDASATVDGADAAATESFLLPVRQDDLHSVDTAPPGAFSPYGTGNSCGSMF